MAERTRVGDMSRCDRAVELVMELYGHETAHLGPSEQMTVASRVISELSSTMCEIADDAFTSKIGTKS